MVSLRMWGATTNRIDAFIVSRKARVFIAGPELTVPTEENIEKQHTIKLKRYSGMASCLSQGWRLGGLLCMEMGCRGVDPPSFGDVLRKLAFSPSEVRQLRDDCAYIARYCSYIIWLNRNKGEFEFPRVYCMGGKVLMDRRSLLADALAEPSARRVLLRAQGRPDSRPCSKLERPGGDCSAVG